MEEIIIKQREFRTQLVNLINDSSLPAFIIKPILEDLLSQINKIDEDQYQEALQKVNEKNTKKGDEEDGL